MTGRDLVAEIAALAIVSRPDYSNAELDLRNFANTPISSVRRDDVELGYGVATITVGVYTYICDVQHEGNTLYISRAVLESDGTTKVLVLGRNAPISWHYYIGTQLVSEIQYSPYIFRRFLEHVTEVATNISRTNWQISSNDGCWVQINGEYNQYILFYDGEDYVFDLTGGGTSFGCRLGAMGVYTRNNDQLGITMHMYDVVKLEAKLDGAVRVWTPGTGWRTAD